MTTLNSKSGQMALAGLTGIADLSSTRIFSIIFMVPNVKYVVKIAIVYAKLYSNIIDHYLTRHQPIIKDNRIIKVKLTLRVVLTERIQYFPQLSLTPN